VKELEELVDDVVERWMERVLSQLRPEKVPRAVDDVRLEDFVEPVGKMAEPGEPDRRGDGEERPESNAVEALAPSLLDGCAQVGQSSTCSIGD
jgi:hypothetical protein